MAQNELGTRLVVDWTSGWACCNQYHFLLLVVLYSLSLLSTPSNVEGAPSKADGVVGNKCQCNNHSSSCKEQVCLNCSHDTAGDQCELCRNGYYGDATKGTSGDCQRCPCSGNRSNGSCTLLGGSTSPTCYCKQGFTGNLCEQCATNYYFSMVNQTCVPCDCNNFEDKSVEGSICNNSSGVCYSCLNHTYGVRCQECEPGHYGYSKHGCQPCFCNHNEHPSRGVVCNPDNGFCTACSTNTTGNYCQYCADGYQGDAVVAKNCTRVAENSDLNTYIAVGTVIGVFIICAVIFACCYYRRNRRSQLLKFYTIQMYDDDDQEANYDIALMDPSTGVEMTSDMIDTTPLTKGLLELQGVDEEDSYNDDDVDDQPFVG